MGGVRPLYHNNPRFATKVEAARKILQGGPKEFVEDEIVGEQLQQLEVHRFYDICTEKDLASSSKKYRLPKAELQKLPMLLVPTEADPGKMESAYAFRSEQFPHRMAVLKSSVGFAKRQRLMTPDVHIQPDQGKELLDCIASEQRDATGQSAIVKRRHAEVPTFSDFMLRLQKQLPGPSGSGGGLEDFPCYATFGCASRFVLGTATVMWHPRC